MTNGCLLSKIISLMPEHDSCISCTWYWDEFAMISLFVRKVSAEYLEKRMYARQTTRERIAKDDGSINSAVITITDPMIKLVII